MRKFLSLLAVIAISAAVAHYTPPRNNSVNSEKQSTLQRVIETKTLRCGYVDYEPANFRDPQTGDMKGILYEVAEAMAKKLDVKIEWVLAGGWASFVTEMQTGKYDAFCGAAWGLMPPELLATTTTDPIYFSAVSAWVRATTTRFNSTLSNVDDPSVTIAATDGSVPFILAQTRYPKAKTLSLPETASYALNLTNVADGKADIGFVETYIGAKYNQANPNTVMNITPNNPVYVAANMFSARKEDADLLNALQMALNALSLNGEIDAIIRKYEPAPGTFLRRAKAYEQTQ